jgi:hypothetical protein
MSESDKDSLMDVRKEVISRIGRFFRPYIYIALRFSVSQFGFKNKLTPKD